MNNKTSIKTIPDVAVIPIIVATRVCVPIFSYVCKWFYCTHV